MKDVIDERDEKARIARSIVKSWNVNYVAKPQSDEDVLKILERLEQEEAADKAAKEAEIEELLEEMRRRESQYNAATGAYSGEYGQDGIGDEVTRGQIERILHEKTEELRSLVERTGRHPENEEPK